MTKNDLQLIRGVARAEFDSKHGLLLLPNPDGKNFLKEGF